MPISQFMYKWSNVRGIRSDQWFSLTMSNNVVIRYFLCCKLEQAVEQAAQLPVESILMWRQSNVLSHQEWPTNPQLWWWPITWPTSMDQCNISWDLPNSIFRCHLTRAIIDKVDGCLTVRYHEVSKPRDSGLDVSNRSEIWQASRQRCQSRSFETSRNLTVRRLTT